MCQICRKSEVECLVRPCMHVVSGLLFTIVKFAIFNSLQCVCEACTESLKRCPLCDEEATSFEKCFVVS